MRNNFFLMKIENSNPDCNTFHVVFILPKMQTQFDCYSGCLFFSDVNECETGAAECPANSRCQNSRGSYRCICNWGYSPIYRDGKLACESKYFSQLIVIEYFFSFLNVSSSILSRQKPVKCLLLFLLPPCLSTVSPSTPFLPSIVKSLTRSTHFLLLMRTCLIYTAEAARCKARGDPHYTTYDNLKYDFMGVCVYTLSKPCEKPVSLPDWNIEVCVIPVSIPVLMHPQNFCLNRD